MFIVYTRELEQVPVGNAPMSGQQGRHSERKKSKHMEKWTNQYRPSLVCLLVWSKELAQLVTSC